MILVFISLLFGLGFFYGGGGGCLLVGVVGIFKDEFNFLVF